MTKSQNKINGSHKPGILKSKQAKNSQVSNDLMDLARVVAGLINPSPFTSNGHSVTNSTLDNNHPGENSMAAVAEKSRKEIKRGRPAAADTDMPEGSGWEKQFARGLIRWRMKQGIPAQSHAAEKFGIPVATWGRIERASSSSITGKNANRICRAVGVDFIDLIALGKPE